MVYGISWNFRSDKEMEQGNVDFATYGVKHICFWRRLDPKQYKLVGKKPTESTRGQPQNDPAWEPCNGQFGMGGEVGQPQNVLCCEFYEVEAGGEMRCVTGVGDGNVLLWRNVSTGDDCTMQVIKKLQYKDDKVKSEKWLKVRIRVRITRTRVRTRT